MFKNIKRALALILVLSMLFLVACDKGGKSDSNKDNNNNAATTTAATTVTSNYESDLLLPTKII